MFYYFSGCFGVVTSVKPYLNFKSWDNRDKPLLLHIPNIILIWRRIFVKKKINSPCFLWHITLGCQVLAWSPILSLKSFERWVEMIFIVFNFFPFRVVKCGKILQSIFIFVPSSNKPNISRFTQFFFIFPHLKKVYVFFSKSIEKKTEERH